MRDEDEYFEWGYRVGDREAWELDYGTDGTWISDDLNLGVSTVDLYLGSEAASIYSALERAGVHGTAIRRRVTLTRGPVEQVAPDTP